MVGQRGTAPPPAGEPSASPDRLPQVRAKRATLPPGGGDIREILEVKRKLDGRVRRFRCEALAVAPGQAIVRFRPPAAGGFRVAGADIPAGSVSYGLFWSDRPYNVYLWVDAAETTLAAYCNTAAETVIDAAGIAWLDLEADVMIVPDGPARVLDLDEVPADLAPDHRDAMLHALAQLAGGAAVLAEAEAETAPFRGQAKNGGAAIAPWLAVADGGRAVAFYRAAFGAVDLERLGDGAGRVVVAHLAAGGADFWVQQGPRDDTRLVLRVNDPDQVFARAIAAGATPIAGVHEEHGWRIGRLADPFGHRWEIGRRLQDPPAAAGKQRRE